MRPLTFLIITRKLYITDMQNYTFSKSLCQEEGISKGFEKIRSNSKFDPCVSLLESQLLFERPKMLTRDFWVDEGFFQMKTNILALNHKKKTKNKKTKKQKKQQQQQKKQD